MNQRILAIITIVLGVLLLISLVFLVLFGLRLADASKVKESEIKSNLTKQETQLKSDFQKERETTLARYIAAEIFGSFSFDYPKVWSTSIKQEQGAREELIFLADPNLIVFDKKLNGPFTALRVEVYGDNYETMVRDMRSKYVSRTVSPYKEEDATVSGVKGKKYTGKNVESKKSVSFVILPLRDKTLFIGSDDSDNYSKHLDTIIKSFEISK